jgi:hypothetical protein
MAVGEPVAYEPVRAEHHTKRSQWPMAHPPLNDLQSLQRQAEAEREFWEEHYQELLTKYSDHFVAVHNGQIIGVKRDLAEITDLIQEGGYEPGPVWTRFVHSARRRWIL